MLLGQRHPVAVPSTTISMSSSLSTSSSFLRLLLALMMLTTCGVWGARGEIYAECESPERLNTFVASQSSCSQYIYCDGENSFTGECLDDNYFNEAAGNCDEPEFVLCLVGGGGNQGPQPADLTQGTPGTQANEVFVASSTSELETATSSDGRPSSDLTTVSKDVSTASNAPAKDSIGSTLTSDTSTSYGPNSNPKPPVFPNPPIVAPTMSTTTTITTFDGVAFAPKPPQPPLTPQCPVQNSPHNTVYLPSELSCSRYFICYYSFAIPMSCPEDFYFSALSGRCERQEQVECALNRPARVHCVKGVYDFLPHPSNCEYYYFCADGFLMVFQCPFDYTWDFERRSCVHRSQANCFTNEVLRQLLHGQRYPAMPFRYP